MAIFITEAQDRQCTIT